MTNYITKYAAKKLLHKEMGKYKNKDPTDEYDPYFIMVEDPRKKGKYKKVKKQIPDYIPEKDAMVLAKVRRRAYRLDCCLFTFFGVRFGWSSVIGLVPAVGDFIDAVLAVYLVLSCRGIECGLPVSVFSRMFLNIAFDFVVGLVPFVGDVLDAGFRANSRNVRLLEEVLDKAYKPHTKGLREGRPKSIFDIDPPATVYEEFSDDDGDRESPRQKDPASPSISRPAPARVPTETRGGERAPPKSGRLSLFGSKRERQPDLEMGHNDSRGPSRTKSGKNARR